MADDCSVRQAWKEATEAMYSKLDETVIADLLGNGPAGSTSC